MGTTSLNWALISSVAVLSTLAGGAFADFVRRRMVHATRMTNWLMVAIPALTGSLGTEFICVASILFKFGAIDSSILVVIIFACGFVTLAAVCLMVTIYFMFVVQRSEHQ